MLHGSDLRGNTANLSILAKGDILELLQAHNDRGYLTESIGGTIQQEKICAEFELIGEACEVVIIKMEDFEMGPELRDSGSERAGETGGAQDEAREADKLGRGTGVSGEAGAIGGEVAHGDGGVEPGAPERAQCADAHVNEGRGVVREDGLRRVQQLVQRDVRQDERAQLGR